MGVKHIFLGLLSKQSMHGYELKSSFDDVMNGQWRLNFGQVYTTLARLERDDLVNAVEVSQGDKPDKKVYCITEQGQKEFYRWLKETQEWNLYPDEMAFKFVAFNMVGQNISKPILDTYRRHLLQLIKHLSELRDNVTYSDLIQRLTIERNILRAEADLKWVEICMKELEGEND